MSAGILAAPRMLVYGTPVNVTAPLNRGLVGWWRVLPQRIGGVQWFDLLRAIPGALIGMGPSSATSGWGATTHPGGQGELRFDGTDDRVDLALGTYTFSPTGTYSWALWVKPLRFTEWQGLLSHTVTAGASPQIAMYVMTSTNATWGPVTAAVTAGWDTSSGNGVFTHMLPNSLATGIWSHVVVTYDGAQAQASRWTLYANGLNVTQATVSAGTLASIAAVLHRVGTDTYVDPFLQGSLDDLRFYSRVLSATEARTLYVASRLGYQRELNWLAWPPAWGAPAAAGRTTKNTRAFGLGMQHGMLRRVARGLFL